MAIPHWGVYVSPLKSPHWGVYTLQWGVSACTLPSGEPPLGSVHSPSGTPHWGVYTLQWGVPTGECTQTWGDRVYPSPPLGYLLIFD